MDSPQVSANQFFSRDETKSFVSHCLLFVRFSWLAMGPKYPSTPQDELLY